MMLSLLVGAVALLLVSRVLNYQTALKTVQYTPGLRCLFSPLGLFGFILPMSKWNPGAAWFWEWRKTSYFNYAHDVISVLSYVTGDPTYWTCSIDVAKQLLSAESKTHLVKPDDMSILLWGDSLVSANGEMWKRHRRIISPSFNVKTYEMVIRETIVLYREMSDAQGWEDKQEVHVSSINALMQRFALVIISRCGFGLSVPWEEPSDSLSMGQALTTVCKTVIVRMILPRWAYSLPIKRLRDIEYAWSTLAKRMPEAVEKRKEELKDASIEQQGDIFTQLVAAFDGPGKHGLDQQEVIGNTFMLMFAGHETTALVLSTTLGFLAIYQEEQQKAFLEVQRAVALGVDPTLQQVNKLHYLHCCFLEALRFCPPGVLLVRVMSEDVPIHVDRPEPKTIVLTKGTRMVFDMIGLHHNPHYFPNPDKFVPSRWHDAPEQATTMFGNGPRACPGRKFAQAEAICLLALILRDWKLDVVLQAGESREEYETRVMGKAGRDGLGFGVGPLNFKMTRRV